MNLQKLLAISLIVIGVIGLAYGGFSYTSDVHSANLGSMYLSFSEKQNINIPIWAGVAFIFVGGLMLARRKL